MTIIADSREQRWDHVRAYFDRNGIKWIRSKLPVGDYGRIDNLATVIDRKKNLNEVESNLIHDHERFRAECVRAKENGIRLIVLVESGSCRVLDDVAYWQNPRWAMWNKIDRAHAEGRMLYRKIPPRAPVTGVQLYKIMQTMADKYGIEWRFCLHQNAGEEICRILGQSPPRSNAG